MGDSISLGYNAENFADRANNWNKVSREQNQKVTTNIRLDLQSVKPQNVTSVLVNGVSVKNFRITGTNTIEIPWTNRTATTVTVIARDGLKLQTTLWYVRWIPGTGYQPTTLTKSTDVVKTGTELLTRVAATATSVVKGVLSLFR